MPRRLALAVLPLALLVAPLTACTEPPSIPPAEPPSATEPLFASDEEALEAATEAYERYLEISEQIAASPPFDLTNLEGLATAEYLARENSLFESLEENGLRIEGRSSLTASRLQQWYQDPELGHVVIFYGCLDVSGARLFNEQGADITTADRLDLNNVEIEVVEGDQGSLLLNRSDVWSGDPVC